MQSSATGLEFPACFQPCQRIVVGGISFRITLPADPIGALNVRMLDGLELQLDLTGSVRGHQVPRVPVDLSGPSAIPDSPLGFIDTCELDSGAAHPLGVYEMLGIEVADCKVC